MCFVYANGPTGMVQINFFDQAAAVLEGAAESHNNIHNAHLMRADSETFHLE
jgi:hypothetical protein